MDISELFVTKSSTRCVDDRGKEMYKLLLGIKNPICMLKPYRKFSGI